MTKPILWNIHTHWHTYTVQYTCNYIEYVPSWSAWSTLGTNLQLSLLSGIPSLSSSSSHSSPMPSLSVSCWALLMTVGQLSLVFWCPSPSLQSHLVLRIRCEWVITQKGIHVVINENTFTCQCWCHKCLLQGHRQYLTRRRSSHRSCLLHPSQIFFSHFFLLM